MSKILQIIKYPNPILKEKSVKINKKSIKTREFQELYFDMIKTMRAEDGSGLSAPQIGKNIRFIIANTKNGVLGMINPKIIKKSWTTEWNEEGCLSVPNTYGKIKRNKKVSCNFIDINGQEKLIKAHGLMAFIIQHEIDHLNGILFIDKAKDIEKIS
ncbi:MAG: peptide deformylase [Parcubacteria group bacterium]|nr:peptide deformylase [Parcubacteria group bacterium]